MLVVGMTTQQILDRYFTKEVTQIIGISGVYYKHYADKDTWFIYEELAHTDCEVNEIQSI